MKKLLIFTKKFADWMFVTSYQQNVEKVGNPVLYAYSYLSFIYSNMFIFFYNIITWLFKFNTISPLGFVIVFSIILFFLYYYYELTNVKNKINFKSSKQDDRLLTIIFFISVILCFGSYACVTG